MYTLRLAKIGSHETVSFALAELEKYLKLIDKRLPVDQRKTEKYDSENTLTLYVGLCGLLPYNKHDDEILIDVKDGVGIITGARLYAVAAVATVIIAIVFIIMLKIFKGRKPVYLFVLRFDSAIQQDLGRVLAKLDGQVRNKSVSGGVTEITIEMQLKNNNTSFVDKIAQIDGVHSAVLVNYNGDFAD